MGQFLLYMYGNHIEIPSKIRIDILSGSEKLCRVRKILQEKKGNVKVLSKNMLV